MAADLDSTCNQELTENRPMDNFTNLHFLLIILLIFIASSVTTAIGFGLNIMLISFLQFFMPPVQIVGLAIVVGTLNAAIRVVETRQVNTSGISWRMIVPGVLAIPLGLTILYFSDTIFLKRLFSVIILAGTVLLVGTRKSMPGKLSNSKPAQVKQMVLGAAGGLMGGLSGMAAIAIVFCSLIQNWEKMLAHAVFARYFFVIGIAAGIGLYWIGLCDGQTMAVGLYLTPIVWLGFATGIFMRHRISQQRFRTYTTICLIVLAVVGFVNTFFVTS